MMENNRNRRWVGLGIAAIVLIICVAAIIWSVNQRGSSEATIDPAAYKTGFVENCLQQANAAAMAQGKSYNEEQKRILQQVCSCGADRTLQQFTPEDVAAFKANPGDEAMLNRIKGIMQSCAAATSMPANNP
ncbi:MAG TPA: hypothetical protein VN229_11355 [Terriglobales bacterium]|nr:hypothetical protein [Terriglobales bacterium]